MFAVLIVYKFLLVVLLLILLVAAVVAVILLLSLFFLSMICRDDSRIVEKSGCISALFAASRYNHRLHLMHQGDLHSPRKPGKGEDSGAEKTPLP